MANGGIIGPLKVVCTPSTKVASLTSSGQFTRHNCTVTAAPEILVVAGGAGGGNGGGPEPGGGEEQEVIEHQLVFLFLLVAHLLQ